MNPRAHSPLISDMQQALACEFGACAVYRLLSRRARDSELAQVLTAFHEEECEQIERLRRLILELGGQAPPRSLRRMWMARLLYAATFLGARGIALRSCYESECTVLRWYHGYAGYLSAIELRGPARTCEMLALTKERHARILEAWVRR